MNNDENSIKICAAETSLSDQPPINRCNYCKKQGMPILIARYAVRSTVDKPLLPIMHPNKKVAEAMPWDLRPERTIKVRRQEAIKKGDNSYQIQEAFDSETLPSFSEYILRRPRKGYIYIYDEIYGGQWRGYYVDKRGYIKSEILSSPTSLVDVEEFSCSSKPENTVLGSIITLPQPNITRKIYLSYVEAPWSTEWRKKITEDEEWRVKHMQSFTMTGNTKGPDIYPIDQLENLVLEYSNDSLISNYDPASILDKVSNTISGPHKIAGFTKKILIDKAKEDGSPEPFILALHDDIGITLHLNELRVEKLLELQDKLQNKEEHRRNLCITSIMSLEDSIKESPYVEMVYDPSKDYRLMSTDQLWKAEYGSTNIKPRTVTYGTPQYIREIVSSSPITKPKPVPLDFKIDPYSGRTYKQALEEKERRIQESKTLYVSSANENNVEKDNSEEISLNGLEKSICAEVDDITSSWEIRGEIHEQIAQEFYNSKYFSYEDYYHQKIRMLQKEKRNKELSKRMDLDYCWWLENMLSSALECYDDNDLNSRSTAVSLLSRALTGGIVAQSSRDLWKKFHDAPEENNIIIKGVLGWNDSHAELLKKDLSKDIAADVSKINKKKSKRLFEEYYIKETGKLIKKLNSLYKDRKKIIEKDFSKKALSAFKRMHANAQSIADTIESTHASLISSEKYLAINGLTEKGRRNSQHNVDNQKLIKNETHISGLKVTQFKMLRIMFNHALICRDIEAHVKSLEEINEKILSRRAMINKLESSYSRVIKKLFVINNMKRNILFFERPITDFFDDITRLKEQKISSKLDNLKNDPIIVRNNDSATNKDQSIKYNNPDTYLYSSATIEQPFIYSDKSAPIIESAVANLSSTANNSGGLSLSENIDTEIQRKKYNKILREEYGKFMVNDFRDRWIGRLSRMAIYWGFVESFIKLCKKPTDLEAWWKMSGSVVFVTQSCFDAWEQVAKQRAAYLSAAQEAEMAEHGIIPEYLAIGSEASTMEAQFAKLWSKRIGILGSGMSIIDGLRDLAHASYMSDHGETQRDINITTIRGGLNIASGIVGILLIETVFIGGVIALFAFGIALWLLPSTETLMPLGIRNWLRRSLFRIDNDNLLYLPFKDEEEEQAAFKTVMQGIDIDTELSYHSNLNLNPAPPFYTLKITMNIPLSIINDIDFLLKIKGNESFPPIFNYSIIEEPEVNSSKPKMGVIKRYNLQNKTSLPSRFTQKTSDDYPNPSIKIILDSVEIQSYFYIDRKKKSFEKGHIEDHKKKETLELSIRKGKTKIIDSYTINLDW